MYFAALNVLIINNTILLDYASLEHEWREINGLLTKRNENSPRYKRHFAGIRQLI